MDADSRALAHLSPALPATAPLNSLRQPIPPMREAHPGRTEPPFTIRQMRADDLPFVVRTHREHFPDGFFNRLGPAFLTAYFKTYLDTPLAQAYVAELHGAPAGYLTGVLDPPAHRRDLLRRHGPRLTARGVAGLSLRPVLALHFLRTRLFLYGRKLLVRRAPARPDTPAATTTAVLTYVAVDARARSRGIGERLLTHFASAAARSGCPSISLVTALGNKGAGPFYERLGWQHRGVTRTADGEHLAAYELQLGRRGTETGLTKAVYPASR